MAGVESIGAALQFIRSATDVAKAVLGAKAALTEAELKMRIAELLEALTNARVSILDAQTEIDGLQQTLLRRSAEARERLVTRDNVYFFRDGEGEAGPYCPRCYEAGGMQMPVTRLSKDWAPVWKYECPQCKNKY